MPYGIFRELGAESESHHFRDSIELNLEGDIASLLDGD